MIAALSVRNGFWFPVIASAGAGVKIGFTGLLQNVTHESVEEKRD